MSSLRQERLLSRNVHDGAKARPVSHAANSDRKPTLHGPVAWSSIPGSEATQLRRATLGNLQSTHGNAHAQRLIGQPKTGISPTNPPMIRRQPAATPLLRVGSRGPAVVALQQQLKGAGAAVDDDGIFGQGTKMAVMAFQKSAGLEPDGVVGAKTSQALQGGGAAASTTPAAGGPAADPRQAVVLAKLGQVKAAIQGMTVKGGAGPTPTSTSTAQGALEPIIGQPIPTCGIKLPGGHDAPPKEAAPGSEGVIQRDFLDDAAEWVGETAEEAGQGLDAAAEWAGDQVNQAANWADEAASSAAGAVGEAAEAVGQMASATGKFVEEQASHVAEQAGEVVGTVVETVKETVEGGIDKAVEVATGIAKDIGEFGEDLKNRFSKEISTLGEVIQDIGKPLLGGDIPGMLKKLDDLLSGLTGGGTAGNWFGWFGQEDKDLGPPSKVHGLLDTEGSITRGGVQLPGGTGYTEPRFSFDDIKWWRAADDIMIQGKLKIDCHYEIAGSERGVSISDSNQAEITENSYLTVIHDLQAIATSNKTGQAQTTYWSVPLVTKHELFHCHDYIGHATQYNSTAQSWLEKQEITQQIGTDDEILGQVNGLMETLRKQIHDDALEYQKNGGEDRAYGDGLGAYTGLINQIKAMAKKEKWKGLDSLE